MKRENAAIHVCFRKRPLPEEEKTDCLVLTKEHIKLCSPHPNKPSRSFQIKPDIAVWPEEYTNPTIFREYVQPHLQHFLVGGGGDGLVLMMYGQTGSGKTYTLIGDGPLSHTNGLIQYCMEYIYQSKATFKKLDIACYEIYNEHMTDLLNPNTKIPTWTNLLEAKGNVEIGSLEKAKYYMKLMTYRKKMGKTKANDQSSRSHTIYRIRMDSRWLIFIDLAGNERGCYSVGQNRAEMREGSSINQSLFSLKECIRAFRTRKSYIPYRRSRLTQTLRTIFEGKFQMHFIATLSSRSVHFHDTLDTLRYGYSLYASDLTNLERRIIPQPPPERISTIDRESFLERFFKTIMTQHQYIQKYHRLYKKYSSGNPKGLSLEEVIKLIERHKLFILQDSDYYISFRDFVPLAIEAPATQRNLQDTVERIPEPESREQIASEPVLSEPVPPEPVPPKPVPPKKPPREEKPPPQTHRRIVSPKSKRPSNRNRPPPS